MDVAATRKDTNMKQQRYGEDVEVGAELPELVRT
jgi:hypothetical protein